MAIEDPIIKGLNKGWRHINGANLSEDKTYEADIVIIGSGAGGGTAAEILAKAGFNIIIVEAGPLKSSSHFNMEEQRAYNNLYQSSAAMKTSDSSIAILQGRAVGGSTTVNWTTSLRTPTKTLDYWSSEKSVTGLSATALNPWFELMEKRLNIKTWTTPPNSNNRVLQQGCEKLGWQYSDVKRNVKQCINIGYCGMGCPVNAKQSMLVTTLPSALDEGATLVSQVKMTQLEFAKESVYAMVGQAVNDEFKANGIKVTFKAKHFILAAGAIHTPVLMMRSLVADPYELVGRNTFLHPSLFSLAKFDTDINAHSGAPQSIVSDEFLWPKDKNEIGYKLEVPPIHPVMLATKSLGFGQEHFDLMKSFNQIQATIALMRDGFNNESLGGRLSLTDSGFSLDYPLNDTFWRAARKAYLSMAELQFAAGAKCVLPMNDGVKYVNSWHEAKQTILNMSLKPLTTLVGSAHVMGGCPMGEDKKFSMVDCYGRSHYLENLSVMDGSIFPTSLGANPQLTIYAIIARNATKLAAELKS